MEDEAIEAHSAWAQAAVASLLDACVGTLVMAFAAEVSELAQLQPDE